MQMGAWRKTIIREAKLAGFCSAIFLLTRFTEMPLEPYYIGFVMGFWATSAVVLIATTMSYASENGQS